MPAFNDTLIFQASLLSSAHKQFQFYTVLSKTAICQLVFLSLWLLEGLLSWNNSGKKISSLFP